MDWGFSFKMGFEASFWVSSLLLGVGLSMDAFSISLANGLNEPKMKGSKMCAVAGVFAFFQALMPMIGWLCVHTIAQRFRVFERMIPWIALILLSYIGINMLLEGLKSGGDEEESTSVSLTALLVQGVATSIDALSVGFAIAHYDVAAAFVTALVIAAVTFVLCMGGLVIGKTAGTKLAGKAGILGGVILIFIGLKIFIGNFL